MRAELVLMGKRVEMAQRTRRRTLVVCIYVALAAMLVGFWFIDQWRVSGPYLVLATIPFNRFFLGGNYFGGLIKPFRNRPPRRNDVPPPFILLALRVYRPPLGETDYINDERELHQRDLAHYHAYQAVTIALLLIWLLSNPRWMAGPLPAWFPLTPSQLVYGLILAAVVTAATLPQSILLWTEPDLEQE